MKKICLLLAVVLTAAGTVAGQEDEEVILDEQTVDLYNEAIACSERGNYREAVTKLLKAAERTPGARRIYMSMVSPCFNSNQLSVLKEQLRKAKALFPGDDEICYYLGTVYQRESNQTMAIRELSLAIDHARQKESSIMLPVYYTFRGNSYLKLDQFDKALADYNSALALGDGTGAIYANRGIANYKVGKRDLACKDWKRAKSMGISSVNQYITKYCK
jgi:tetratricopeptide (TPR) repeat protein